MIISPLTYTVNKSLDQVQQYLESTVLPGNSYSLLFNRYKIRITQNRAGEFFLTTPVWYIHYKIKLTQDSGGDTEICLKPSMPTFYKIMTLIGFLICLLMAFLFLPFMMGQTMPLLDIFVVVMFPIAYFGNTLIGHKQACAPVDAFMKEYISEVIGK